MDVLLSRVTAQAMNYATRSGVTITATYAIKQCGRLLKQAPRSKHREELARLQLKLEGKIRIISPAIDMIDLITARGNTTLGSAASLTKEVRLDIQKLGTRLSDAANDEELVRRGSSRAKRLEDTEREMRAIIDEMKALIDRIEDAVPLISLAITTSGVNLSTKLSGTISPSRLLQASTFLTAADSGYTANPKSRQQVGPTYVLSLYMLFTGHASRQVDEQGVRETTWKEVLHKARVKLIRLPLQELYSLPGEQPARRSSDFVSSEHVTSEFAYQLLLVEDMDDDRFHTNEDGADQSGPYEDVANAGIRDVVPVHEISKVFYADTGKILNIGDDSEVNHPVLLIKRDVSADAPRRMVPDEHEDENWSEADELYAQSHIDAQLDRESAPNTPLGRSTSPETKQRRLPTDLDPEWMAFEVYFEGEEDSEDNSDPEAVDEALSKLHLSSPSQDKQLAAMQPAVFRNSPSRRTGPQIKTSLSLLEMLLKLTALQQFRQESHLAIEDELLNFFLEDSATAGAGPDKQQRQRFRQDAMRRVGFDPYDESPIKRRNEEYIAHPRGAASPRPLFQPGFSSPTMPYDEDYEYERTQSPSPRGYTIELPSHLIASAASSPGVTAQTQTPSRTSTPGSVSDSHRQAVKAKYSPAKQRPASIAPSGSPAATPSSTTRSRQGYLRTQSDSKPQSPLGRTISRPGLEGGE